MAKWKIVEEDEGYDLSDYSEETDEKRNWHVIEEDEAPQAEYNHPDADPVDHPAHYNNGGIECIDYLQDNMSWEGFTGYLEGNCKKYMHRWRYKAKPLEDLKKARWYLDRLIEELEGPDE